MTNNENEPISLAYYVAQRRSKGATQAIRRAYLPRIIARAMIRHNVPPNRPGTIAAIRLTAGAPGFEFMAEEIGAVRWYHIFRPTPAIRALIERVQIAYIVEQLTAPAGENDNANTD